MNELEQTRGELVEQKLLARVHPVDWQSPEPADRYHLVVVGAGTAGLVSAAGAASLGARVAIVEQARMGGDCLNTGCVPSKALLSAARIADVVRKSTAFGIERTGPVQVDFRAVMERMRALQAELAAPDSARRFQQLGVDVFFGNGSFTSHNSVDVGGVQLRFKKAVIATGTRPAVPPVPGLESVHYLTNETIFSLTELPKRLAIIGGGPVGCELAQAFVRFGSEVYLIESSSSILPREERDAADLVAKALKRDGVHLLCSAKHLNVSQTSSGIKVTLSSNKKHHEVNVDHLLVAAGRVANVEQLGLEKAGVAYDQQSGVVVNDRLQTTNRKIYAAGDVCSKYKFTHAADAMARIVIGNSLFGKRDRFSRLILPWCTYTSPEIARVGLSQQEADAAKIPIDTYTQPLAEIDRAVLDGHPEGFIRVHARRGSATILGATIVAERAGELIGEITQVMTHRLSLKDLSSTIHPYPTVGAGISKIGDQYNRTRLTPLVKGLLAKWFAWR